MKQHIEDIDAKGLSLCGLRGVSFEDDEKDFKSVLNQNLLCLNCYNSWQSWGAPKRKGSFALVTKYDPLREQVEDLLFDELGHKITGAEAATITEKILDCLRDKLADITDG